MPLDRLFESVSVFYLLSNHLEATHSFILLAVKESVFAEKEQVSRC